MAACCVLHLNRCSLRSRARGSVACDYEFSLCADFYRNDPSAPRASRLIADTGIQPMNWACLTASSKGSEK